jgi:4-amino-4-deoxy-L-arabinose transferase-like glycosyltransferase
MPSTNVGRHRRLLAVAMFLLITSLAWTLREAARRTDGHGLRRSDGTIQREVDCEDCGDVAWTGTWFFPRGGAYLLFVDAIGGRARLEVDGETVVRAESAGPPARALASRVYGAGAHAVRVAHEGAGGVRLFWIPPGRRCDPEYLPAAALSPLAPTAAGPMPSDLADREDASVATAVLIALGGLALGLAGERLRWRPARFDLWAGTAVFAVALAVRLWRLGAYGQTWDEDCYWSAGRNDVLNLLRLDFRPSSWAWNHEHPPVAKYLVGLAALWHDGYGPARAVQAVLGAATCVVVFALGRDLFSRRVGVGAALLYAFLPHAVAHSQITGLETPSTLLATVAFWAFVRRRPFLAGLAGGTAAACRFIAGLVFVSMAAATAVHPPRDRREWLRLAASPVVGLAALLAVWPWLWIQAPIAALRASLGKLTVQHAPEWFLGELVQAPVPKHYLFVYFAATATLPMLAGMALCALRRDRATAVCALFFASPFLVAFSPVVQNGVRYIMPALPPAALLAAAGIDAAASRLRWPRAPLAALAVAVASSALSCLAVTPYGLDYYNALFGGSRAAFEGRRFLVGWWGEGVGPAVARLNAVAERGAAVYVALYPDHVAWLRPDLRPVSDPDRAAYALVNHFQHEHPPAGFREVFRETLASGVPLAAVYVRDTGVAP